MSLFILAVALAFAACELPGSAASLCILLPGASGSRAVITSDSVQRLLTYEVKLSSAGRQTVTQEAAYGQSIEITLEPGKWTVELNAYFRKHGNNIANFPVSQEVLLMPGKKATVDVAMRVNEWLLGRELITNTEEFKKIGTAPSNGGWFGMEKDFLLLTDLTLDNWDGTNIWGTSAERAIFDGGGHTITIKSFNPNRPDGPAQNYGLFVDAFNANIKNLTVKLEIGAANSIQNVIFAGGVTALGSNVDMENVRVSGTLNVVLDTGFSNSFVGGIAGEISNGTIDQCSSTLAITLQPSSGGNNINIGGLVGETTNVDIVSSFSSGTMTVEQTTGLVQAGGIVGQAYASGISKNIKSCYSAGNITVNGGTCYTGGIVGTVDGAQPDGITVMSSYSSAIIIVSNSASTSSAGGIAGILRATPFIPAIKDCFALNPSITTTSGGTRRIVGIAIGTAGELNGNYALAGMAINGSTMSNTDGTDENGADLTLSNPPQKSDFPSLDFLWFFAMPPVNWAYPYPVFQWQIEEGIQP